MSYSGGGPSLALLTVSFAYLYIIFAIKPPDLVLITRQPSSLPKIPYIIPLH
jgi:hypothetical protein